MKDLLRPFVITLLAAGVTASTGQGADARRMVSIAALNPGTVLGVVADSSGAVQMGATVWLLNRYDRPIVRAVTNDRGQFGFDQVLPDIYSIKVTLASFVPAMKSNIQVQAGRASFLNIHLASLLSSVELFYSAPGTAQLMSEEWKWVLRGASATRPVLRLLPGYDVSQPVPLREASIFSDTRGLVKLSAGESEGYTSQQDLGTSFAMATSLFRTNHVGVSGNVGYSPTNGTPVAGFLTSYRRGSGDAALMNPEVKLTMRQVFLPLRAGGGILNGSGAPVLRTLSLAVAEKKQISDELLVEYGFSLDSVTFIERLNYVSPYARATYDLGTLGAVEFGFSSGAPPIELLNQRDERHGDLSQNLATLGMFPRLTLAGGTVQRQRTENYEVGYQKVMGTRTLSLAAYRETMRNGALTMAGANGLLPVSDLLPDLNSNSSVFNIGSFRRMGYSGTITEKLSDSWSAAITVGRGGVLRTEQRELGIVDPSEIRAALRRAQQLYVTMRLNGTLPRAGTRLGASYQWTDYRSLTPGHMYLTQRTYPEAGLNFSIRQPVPGLFGMAGRMEIHAEARNMLAQGYLPLDTPFGRRMLLIHTPRALRGGVSFFF
ncbi:MAG: carboxypeptidase regulatory-like domain-containing protein [Bryobacteraceae bacterium]|nr:carboxypeptidase regulatory-like domain-containing protein [Bryobacteraceae bacterium]